MNRRAFLHGLLAAPVVITTPGLLMPVRAMPPEYMLYVSEIGMDGEGFIHCRPWYSATVPDIADMRAISGQHVRYSVAVFTGAERVTLNLPTP